MGCKLDVSSVGHKSVFVLCASLKRFAWGITAQKHSFLLHNFNLRFGVQILKSKSIQSMFGL